MQWVFGHYTYYSEAWKFCFYLTALWYLFNQTKDTYVMTIAVYIQWSKTPIALLYAQEVLMALLVKVLFKVIPT